MCYSRDAWKVERHCTCFNFTVVLFPFLSSPWGSVYRFCIETSLHIFDFVSQQKCSLHGTLSRLFARPGFRLFCVRLAVHYFAVYSVLGSLIVLLKKAKLSATGNEYNGCTSVRYNSLFISLPLFTKGHRMTTWKVTFCMFERTWTVGGQFLKFEAVLHILFGIFLTV